MNKKFSILIALLLGVGIFLSSCSTDDNTNQVSQEWIDYQKAMMQKVVLLTDAKGKTVYTKIESDLGNKKYIYYRSSEFIANNLLGKFDKKGPDAFAIPKNIEEAEKREVIDQIKYDTDIAVTRYHGWYYDLEGEKVVFDTTEVPNGGGKAAEFQVGGLTEGFKTALYNMNVGEEWIVCIPYDLAYGTSGYNNIPGYTTLFFDLKLMAIKR